MLQPPSSQAAPLPNDLPFRVISRTIGSGAYAFIRKAIPLDCSEPIVAIKFINKDHAFNRGRLRPKQLQQETMLHNHLQRHKNIIEFLGTGEDAAWKWIAMELADGGDLFDKIEADVGVGGDIAHFYFAQLISAVSYMHSKGVAHRDIKPENLLLSAQGNLKVADFGLATLYRHNGKTRTANSVVGSPPYIAPEIVSGKRLRSDILEQGYRPDISDVWSCGVVLFVLLVGNTPWDEPTQNSYEFGEYITARGRGQTTNDELWQAIPPQIISLLHGMLKLDPPSRFSLNEVRTHPWFTRSNPHLNPTSGQAVDPVNLATQMMQSLRVDFSPSQQQRQFSSGADPEAMDLDTPRASQSARPPAPTPAQHLLPASSTQPTTPFAESPFDWERPASQGDAVRSRGHHAPTRGLGLPSSQQLLTQDPSLSQFTGSQALPLTVTQAARRFNDILPGSSLARFVSATPLPLLAGLLSEALRRLSLPAEPVVQEEQERASVRVEARDGRKQPLKGTLVVERYYLTGGEIEDYSHLTFWEVRFVKAKGDPLEWRRLFKAVCGLCKEAVFVPASV